ncbi:MAG: IS30 family transposase [Bacillaceae bacterium]|nr:IS30 family transposase [Bacillaceae bacterium]
MNPKDYNTNKRNFKQINYEDRIKIEHLYNKQKKSYKEIGEELGKHRTSIYREVQKGLVELQNSDLSIRKDYSAVVAENTKSKNAELKGPSLKIANDYKLAEYIKNRIKDKYSPEVIAEEIKNSNDFEVYLSFKTIYNYIEKGILMVEINDLTYGKYRKKKGEKKVDSESRLKLKEGKTIRDRPLEVEDREELGHWEMDLVEGKKNDGGKVLLVLTERCSRKEIIELLPNKTQNSVIKALDKIERKEGVKNFREKFKTITTDNGSEFLNYEGIEQSYTKSSVKRTTQYFADAYSSWQRGSNENQNKMIRRFLPKGSSFKDLKKSEVKMIENWMNNYPRKMFGFKNPNKVYEEKLNKVA